MNEPKHTTAPTARTAPPLERRRACVLLHLTSLPGGHGIGDLGEAAHRFAGFLREANVAWWQMLPVGPIGLGDSPYMSPSTFAGNPLFVDLRALAREGWLDAADLDEETITSGGRSVVYERIRPWKEERLRRASARFAERASAALRQELQAFAEREHRWLPDYALYQTLRERFGVAWPQWPDALRDREPQALEEARARHAAEIAGHVFEQWCFDRQWQALREHCHELRVSLIGDVPIYVAHDSAEVWAHRELFKLDEQGEPRVVAGVPSDYFAEGGQLWGNPLYDWERMAKNEFAWWHERLHAMLARFDAVRLDHFIGFRRYWEVPFGAPDARSGRWCEGPGPAFFESLEPSVLRRLIAEDLGSITPAVHALRDRFELPGMRVLQFGLNGERSARPHLPHCYPRHCVAYSGTHDFDTLVGWFQGTTDGRLSEQAFSRSRRFALDYVNADAGEFHRAAIRTLWMSRADLVVVPLQDLLGLGTEARMNRPGTPTGNWRWRAVERDLRPDLAEWVRDLSTLYDRWGEDAA